MRGGLDREASWLGLGLVPDGGVRVRARGEATYIHNDTSTPPLQVLLVKQGITNS